MQSHGSTRTQLAIAGYCDHVTIAELFGSIKHAIMIRTCTCGWAIGMNLATDWLQGIFKITFIFDITIVNYYYYYYYMHVMLKYKTSCI